MYLEEDEIGTAEVELEKISASIELFKRFTATLNSFLEKQGFGSAEFYLCEFPEHVEGRGYNFAMLTVADKTNADILYMYVYTGGTVMGENITARESIDCNWMMAIRETLRTIASGDREHLSEEWINKITKMLDGN